ncbi:pirin family protein [Hymenobacter fodinae]|uniref:Quercetin 2,3-dioxygenase C-terminal cupin domain-containing protein n=1 Tax=Hymenobacter fodinae TaxID=2510796 RepID=A0A4Z0P4Y8_9BACT|nr:hypothetical protein [Hymenobacter fodinae]TGE06341.1 hypothetical protein EU556_15950 [Hymenobacter fodinae]
MIRQTPGKIFLADQRGLLETSQFRRYSTLNFGTYQAEHKVPVGSLIGFNEETLAGGHSLELVAPTDAHVLLIPITGEVAYKATPLPSSVIGVEEVQLLALPAHTSLRVSNPYDSELISFLHIWIRTDEPIIADAPQLISFDTSAIENRLHCLMPVSARTPAYPFAVHLGQFAGRQEAVYQLRPHHQLFAFVLAGAFEVEGRLLHEKDGLALWDAEEVEFEALSNNALVLVLELPD